MDYNQLPYIETVYFNRELNDIIGQIRSNTQFFDSNLLRAECFLGLAHYDDALQEYEFVLKLVPHNCSILLLKGECLAKKKIFDQALSIFDKVLQMEPLNHKAYLKLGECYFLMDNYKLAIKNTEKSLKLHNDENVKKFHLGLIKLQQSNRFSLFRDKQFTQKFLLITRYLFIILVFFIDDKDFTSQNSYQQYINICMFLYMIYWLYQESQQLSSQEDNLNQETRQQQNGTE